MAATLPMTTHRGAYVRLSVADSGVGISPDLQTRIFEPFFTTKGPGKGTGLGLATVRSIVELCGGHVRVVSESNRGARFDVWFPALPKADPQAKPQGHGGPSLRGTESILLVEDDEAVRSLARQILQQFGYTVVAAASGPEAIRYVEQQPDPINLVITDVVMPGMGGRTLAESLTHKRPGIKVLFISGYTDDAIIRHGVSEADVAFIPKPFTVEALAGKVRQVLNADVA
jgi:CheY-like chemotaxis protein